MSPKRVSECWRCIALFTMAFAINGLTLAQIREIPDPSLQVTYISFRPAVWETDHVFEPENERVNQGGMIYAYFRNISEQEVRLRHWMVNRQNGPSFRLSGDVAWDRFSDNRLVPGQTGVAEISAVSKDFSKGQPFEFVLIDRSWRPAAGIRTTLQSDSVWISSVVIDSSRKNITLHLKSRATTRCQLGDIYLEPGEVLDQNRSSSFLADNGHVIAQVRLKESLPLAEMLFIGVDLEFDNQGSGRTIWTHRRIFPDYFPIGTWGVDPEHFQLARQHHIDTIVKGGSSRDSFYSSDAEKYGFRTMVHTGVLPDVDVLRDLGSHPAVACWMIQDEPDWTFTPQMMLAATQMTRKYNKTKPTFITLCRNVKFFEYAGLPDIPCQDHYSVTAPSSSKWPFRYGTRLEETAYYTRDLKNASEPKPIWVWTQGIFDWDERPKRPVPTPDEMAAQLLFNVGRGAKGILWFTFKQSVAQKYPDLAPEMQHWGRVMSVCRRDWLDADPLRTEVKAPENVDVALLLSPERLTVIVVNLDYRIDDTAYEWQEMRAVRLHIALPEWFDIEGLAKLDKTGPQPFDFTTDNNLLLLEIDTLGPYALFVAGQDKDLANSLSKQWHDIRALEERTFSRRE